MSVIVNHNKENALEINNIVERETVSSFV
jgi:hypothetical protein